MLQYLDCVANVLVRAARFIEWHDEGITQASADLFGNGLGICRTLQQ